MRPALALVAPFLLVACTQSATPPCFLSGETSAALANLSTANAQAPIHTRSVTDGCVMIESLLDYGPEPGQHRIGQLTTGPSGSSLLLTALTYDGDFQARLTLRASWPGAAAGEAELPGLSMRWTYDGGQTIHEESATEVQVTVSGVDGTRQIVTGQFEGSFPNFGSGRFSGQFAAPVEFVALP